MPKVQLNFKTPDVIDYAMQELHDSEQIFDENEVRRLLKRFVRYGECINVEIDTDTQEAKVVPV